MKVLWLASLLWVATAQATVTLADLHSRQVQLAYEHELLLRELPDAMEIVETIDPVKTPVIVKRISAFFRSYDDFNMDKIDYFQEEAIKRAHSEAKNHPRLNKKIMKALRELEEARALYLERKILFRTDRDTERLDIASSVLQKYGLFAKEVRKARGERVRRNFGAAKILPFIDTPIDLAKVADRVVVLLWNSFFRTRTRYVDRAPIPEALARVERRLVNIRDVKIQWDGLDNLEDVSHDGKTLNLFLINHAHSFLDTAAQQALPLKGLSSIGNVDIIFPPFLARQMVKSDHMVTVGHGDTNAKTLDLVRRKKLNKFFLALEGITGAGLYEMRPIMPMVNDAIYASINLGLELKMYPVAFPDNFRLLNDWRDPIEGKKVSRGVLMKPLKNEHCLKLLEVTGNKAAITELIRWAWFSQLNTNENEWLSMPYPREIAARLDMMVWGSAP